MKIFVQVPCYNEADSLPVALSLLPRSMEGVDTAEWLAINGGSAGATVEVAKAHGVDHVVSFSAFTPGGSSVE